MKRFAALFLALCLTAAAAAFAEPEAGRTVDLGEFTLAVGPSVSFQTAERQHHRDVLRARPRGEDDLTAEFTVSWRAEPLLTEEMTDADVAFWAAWQLLYVETDRARAGETVSCSLREASLVRVDGRQALSVVCAMTVFPADGGAETVVCRRDVLVGGVRGYYTFTYTASDPEEPVPALDALLAAVRWAE